MTSNAWLAPIIVALITALGTYLGIARKTSGRIGTTEASDLWAEAKSLREVYQGEITRLRAEIHELEDRCYAMEDENRLLRNELRDLKRKYEEPVSAA